MTPKTVAALTDNEIEEGLRLVREAVYESAAFGVAKHAALQWWITHASRITAERGRNNAVIVELRSALFEACNMMQSELPPNPQRTALIGRLLDVWGKSAASPAPSASLAPSASPASSASTLTANVASTESEPLSVWRIEEQGSPRALLTGWAAVVAAYPEAGVAVPLPADDEHVIAWFQPDGTAFAARKQ